MYYESVHAYMCEYQSVYTFGRHDHFTVDAIRVAAELLQAVDGTLTHYGFSAKRSMVYDLQHNGRGVHLLFGQELGKEGKDCICLFGMGHLCEHVQPRLRVSTTLSSSTDPGKLGFFLKVLMTAV